MNNLEIQEKLNRLNVLEVVEYEGGDGFSVTVIYNDTTKMALLDCGFSEEIINKSAQKSIIDDEFTIDLIPFASEIGYEEWKFCGGFAANMILHTQQALTHLLSGNRVTSLQSGESYALEDMEGHDLTFTLTELSGLWNLYQKLEVMDNEKAITGKH